MPRAPAFFQALPPYLGGKRRLCPLIFAALAEVVPRKEWPGTTFLDPMCGGGAVALYAKAHGFRTTASDLAERGAIVARALVANDRVRFERADCVRLVGQRALGPTSAHNAPPATAAQQQWLAQALATASHRSEPRRSLLRLLIVTTVLRWYPLSMPSASDAEAAAQGDFDRISSRRLGHYVRARRSFSPDALWQTAEAINRGVFGGHGVAAQGDARAVIAATSADVVYLDPPYPGTTRYERAYARIDRLLGNAPSDAPSPSLDDLLDAARVAPWVVCSYGGPQVRGGAFADQVRRHRPVVTTLSIPYARLRAVATEKTNAQSREYLVIAGRE